MEMSVVLPQPEGPTKSVSCPASTSRSTPRRASVFVPLAPNSFVTPLQDTACSDRRLAAGGGLGRATVAIILYVPHVHRRVVDDNRGLTPPARRLSSKDDCRFECQHAPGADDARGYDDDEHCRPGSEQ